MIQLRKLILALPFAFAVAACSNKRSSGDTGTAAGSIGNDTAAVRTDTNPVPPAGGGIDTSKKATPMDSMSDSAMKAMMKDSAQHHKKAAKKTKKPY